MSALEGELVVRLATEAGRVSRAQARSERPHVAARLFGGRPADEAPRLAAAIFAICGRSQAAAAEAAIEAARRVQRSAVARRAREARIAAETMEEHAWRLLVDWPRLAGQAPNVKALARARESLERQNAKDGAIAWASDTVFGRSPAAFLALDSLEGLRTWAAGASTSVAALASHCFDRYARLGASDITPLPRGDEGWVVQALVPAIDAEDAFGEAPHCAGEPRETGPLARNCKNPLVAAAIEAWGRGVGARFAARLVDLAVALESFRGCHGAYGLGEGSAIAWTETARGLLVHRVLLDGERIARYHIVAPTEWNFHPAGAFAKGALALDASDGERLEHEARWLVASLDPCVAVRYEAGHA